VTVNVRALIALLVSSEFAFIKVSKSAPLWSCLTSERTVASASALVRFAAR